jgi:hypothetical protein
MGTACRTHEQKTNIYTILVEKEKERDNYEDQDVHGSIILKWNKME